MAKEIWQASVQSGVTDNTGDGRDPNDGSPRNDWIIDDDICFIKQQRRRKDAVNDDDWDKALRGVGLVEDLRRRIMKPEFDAIRLTQCACYWALDSVNEAVDFFFSLNGQIAQQASLGNAPGEAIGSRSTPDHLRHHDARDSSSGADHPSAPQQLDGHAMFYKGGSDTRLGPCIATNGRIHVGVLQSHAPTDFHPGVSTNVYLTKDQQACLLHARYIEARFPLYKAAVLHIAIPNALVANPREIFGDDWRDLVWNSRNAKVYVIDLRRLPRHVRQYEEADVLIGPVCGDPTHGISSMSDKSELSVLKCRDGSDASQLVIQSDARLEEIARRCEGLVWIVPCTARAQQWEGR